MARSPFSRRDFLRAGCGLLACGGAQTLLPQLNLISTALAGTPNQGGYKALVCLYLGGGNDAWNLLIPGEASAHAKYVAARNGIWNSGSNTGGLALPRFDGNGFINGQTTPASIGIAGNQFALNPFCPELATLYGQGRVAFLNNIGPLVAPTTRAEYNNRARPPQLYSHNDQTNLWFIGTGTSVQTTEGWGGRVAGQTSLPTSATSGLPPTITLAGKTRFLSGSFTDGTPLFPFSMSTSTTTPATSLNSYSATGNNSTQFQQTRRAALEQMLDVAQPHPFTQEYSDIVERSLNLADYLINPAIAGIPPTDPVNGGGGTGFTWPTGSSIYDQLKQVAKMIRISTSQPDSPGYLSPVGANRQVFYVNIGGFDTHDGQITSNGATGHHALMQRISRGVDAFYKAMVAIGRANDVTLFTASEFARTINSNGNGSDHAWGSVQFAVGGAVNGGMYGRYPSIVLNNALTGSVSDNATQGECFSRGQFIPTLAVDQFSATLARWMGVAENDLATVFPNLGAFTNGVGPFASAASTPTFAYFTPTIPGLMSGV